MSEIWRIGADGGGAQQVTAAGGFRAIETGRGLLYVKREAPGLFLKGADGAERQLTSALLPVDCGNWTVAGDDVYFIARGDGDAASLRRLSLETGVDADIAALDEFPHFSGIAVAPPDWRIYLTKVDLIESDLMMLEGL